MTDVETALREAMIDATREMVADTSALLQVSPRRRWPALAAVAAVVAVVAGASIAGYESGAPDRGAPQSSIGPYSSGIPAGSPVPGITPDFVPVKGLDWYLSRAESDQFYATHTYPSPSAESAALQRQSPDALLADVKAAGLPASARYTSDADTFTGAAAVHVRLDGGIPVEIKRRQSIYPGVVDYPATLVAHIPGTEASAAAIIARLGYEFPPGTPGQVALVHSVRVMTRGGVETTWIAPGDVSLEQLQQWAFAAAAHQG